ncbi:MAG: hypothetical protein QOE33_3571 [Acidobacteriota bacterium]|nr:hypothetical protein [Acidobacteriota bacterium]
MTRALVILLSVASLAPIAHAGVGAREDSSDIARATVRSRLSNASLTRADKLLGELARLDATSFAADAVTTGHAKRAAHTASEIFSRAQSLPESDLKVDLTTAARLYERAFARGLVSKTSDATSSVSCADERPGAYRSLCARQSPRDAIALLVGKARRHVEWARASVAEERGDMAVSVDVIEEMRAERVVDLVCARQALVALSELEVLTNAPATLADYEDEKKIGKVSSTEFGERLNASAQVVKRTLAWMPESQLKAEIDNAWQSYADALWWWERGERRPVVRVTNNKYIAGNFAAMARLTETQLGYNAVVNLRHAREYTRRAESLVIAESSRAGFTTGMQ